MGQLTSDLLYDLANLIMVAMADGFVSEEEKTAIKRICKEINAKKTDFEESK